MITESVSRPANPVVKTVSAAQMSSAAAVNALGPTTSAVKVSPVVKETSAVPLANVRLRVPNAVAAMRLDTAKKAPLALLFPWETTKRMFAVKRRTAAITTGIWTISPLPNTVVPRTANRGDFGLWLGSWLCRQQWWLGCECDD